MTNHARCFAIVLAAMLSGCNLIEQIRLATRIEHDLNLTLGNSPKLISTEDYGWAEEGGDMSLLSLGPADCIAVSRRMTTQGVPRAGSDTERIFRDAGLSPTSTRSRFDRSDNGDWTQYDLDPTSCTVFRHAHFE